MTYKDKESINKLSRLISKWCKENLKFNQLILEYPGPDPRDGWVHISYANDGSNKNQVLTAVREEGKTSYKEGLVYEYA